MRYLFDGLTLDTERRELRRARNVIPIAPQVFDLLDFLIRNRERVVSKDDLIAAIWSGRFVSDAALTTRVNVARKAIGDSGAEQRLIKTLARRGLRFVGGVREEAQVDPGASAGLFPSAIPALAPSDRPTIAVLPFANLPSDPLQDFIGGGIAEDLRTELARRRWLLVISRYASDDCGEMALCATHARRQLGVRYVLQGCVRLGGSVVRITSQLIDAATGVHLWADRYDRTIRNVLAVQKEVAQAMATAIATAIVDGERQRAAYTVPEKLGAWEAYQRGMWHMSQCDATENRLAQSFFRRAIDLDPEFGSGYSGLAWSYMMAASIFSEMPVADGCLLGEPLARKAMALDDRDTEARARLALAALLSGDIQGAIEGSQEALSADADCPDALGVKGAALIYSGYQKEGRAAIRNYLRLRPRDPARPIRLAQIASSQYLEGDYEHAVLTARRIVRRYPQHPVAYRWLAAALGQLNRVAEAQDVLQTLQTRAPSSVDMYVRQRVPLYCRIEYAPLLQGLLKAGWKD